MNLEEILSKHEPARENLLKVLHEIQENDPSNHVSMEAMTRVASWMKVPLSSVYGVLKYYTMYSAAPRAGHIIRVCNSVVCQMKGGDPLKDFVEQWVERFAGDGGNRPMFTVEATECLGHCEAAPVMMVDEQIFGRMDEAESAGILEGIKKNSQDVK